MLRFLLLALAVGIFIWLARRGNRVSASPPPSLQPGEVMVACARCGVHLPRSEALPGKGGVFCGEAHRSAYEREHAQR